MDKKLPEQWAYAKDLSGKFLFVSENFAAAAGADSPFQMIGHTDFDMVWRKYGELYKQGDIEVLSGKLSLNRREIINIAQEPNVIHHIVSTKTALRDNQNRIIGIIASTFDMTNYQILENPGQFDHAGKKFVFNGDLAGLSLSKKQMTILEYIVMGYSAADIAQLLNRSKRTIEGHIEHLKNKLQCNSKAEITRWAFTSGLSHSIGQHSQNF
jgi:DNA-binding CsgD family transcriptional regulator